MLSRLDDRAVIAVTGPEARTFLQGLITNDVEKLAPNLGLYAALLTPQGKVLFDFLLAEGDGAILIDCVKNAREQLLKRLSLYRLRSKVTIEPRDQLEVLAAWNGTQAHHAIVYTDPRSAKLGLRAIGARAEMPAEVSGQDAYRTKRLEFGIPEGEDFGSDHMFALEADLKELNAISFEKGCYVGQELTARMQHRGTVRKRLMPVVAVAGMLPAQGTSVTSGSREIGELTSTYGDSGFALLRLDRLEEAGDADVNAGDVPLRVLRPAWLFP